MEGIFKRSVSRTRSLLWVQGVREGRIETDPQVLAHLRFQSGVWVDGKCHQPLEGVRTGGETRLGSGVTSFKIFYI